MNDQWLLEKWFQGLKHIPYMREAPGLIPGTDLVPIQVWALRLPTLLGPSYSTLPHLSTKPPGLYHWVKDLWVVPKAPEPGLRAPAPKFIITDELVLEIGLDNLHSYDGDGGRATFHSILLYTLILHLPPAPNELPIAKAWPCHLHLSIILDHSSSASAYFTIWSLPPTLDSIQWQPVKVLWPDKKENSSRGWKHSRSKVIVLHTTNPRGWIPSTFRSYPWVCSLEQAQTTDKLINELKKIIQGKRRNYWLY